jgi:predicted amidophosphoribosyltransferase
MELIKKLNPFPLRACMNCGSWLNLRTFFCGECHAKALEQFYSPKIIQVEGLLVKSLLCWPPGKSDVLSALVLQMKNEKLRYWNIWAQEFAIRWEEPNNLRKTLVVASESSSGKKHGENWAQSLAQNLGFDYACPLKPVKSDRRQRELNRQARKAREFKISEDFSIPHRTRVIFADDVVTTGRTALAAFEALKKPSNFEVWSLIYREL